MPIETVPSTRQSYYLICFDAQARERADDPDGHISRRAREALAREPVTDVFLMSHGWMGDIPAARSQYHDWIGAMAAHTGDLDRIRQVRPGFQPLLIGLHWPSLPFGQEELGGSQASFAAPLPPGELEAPGRRPQDQLVKEYAARLADSPAAIEALQTIFDAAVEDVAPAKMPPHVVQAYELLSRACPRGSGGVGEAPGADGEPFDAEAVYRTAEEDVPSFGGFGWGGLLAPLRAMSYWKMKDRANRFGATAAHELLGDLQRTAGPDVRFHLMGHSFGCIVMSAILAGPSENHDLVRPVNSLALIQGALSLWSYASEIDHAKGRAGYFHRILSDGRVRGPMITTQSEHDTAVGRLYPLAAGVAGHVVFAPGELPKYGALGTYGVRGPGPVTVDMQMLAADGSYGFEPGKVYNLESSHIIRERAGAAGAHNDFTRPEVAHAVWEAAMADVA